MSGSPDLAPTIFRKIEQAAVFVADVTLVGETTPVGEKAEGRAAKKLINSNVAIEYGYAHHALGDARILMVQNRHFGEREDLPFDLKHKGGPIQYSLAPGAPAAQIDAEKAQLRGNFVTALRPYLSSEAAQKVAFQEVQATSNPAVFFDPSEVLARVGVKGVDEIEYRFSEPRVFYLRLIPTRAREQGLALYKKRAADLRNHLHNHHPNLGFQEAWKPLWTLSPGVPIGCRLPRKRGPYSMPIHK